MATATTVTSPATAGFADQDEELQLDEVPVSGELPEWLHGSLVRVTPAKFDLPGGHTIRHWFDGLAMLHRFAIADGRVSYANRFLRSDAYERAQRGDGIGQGFATDPCRAIFKRIQTLFSPDLTDNANVCLAQIGERYVAMTETPLPVEFDPRTLETVGHPPQAPGSVTTAHPHRDPSSGDALNYAAHISARNSYRVYATGADGSHRVLAQVPVKSPSYMHSFSVTERYAVLTEYPLLLNPMRLALSMSSFIESYEWKPERGTRFTVIDRASGEVVRRGRADAFFSFHHVNAWEEGDEVVVDLIAYDDARVIDELYIDKLRTAPSSTVSTLRRYRVRPGVERVEEELLLDRKVELPRIDYARVHARPYRVLYAESTRPGTRAWADEVLKFDLASGAVSTWSADGCYPGEPIFVGRPGRDAEDDGVVLSVVFDSAAARSFLLVLDAGSFTEIARAEAPHRVPFGFHGQFFRDA